MKQYFFLVLLMALGSFAHAQDKPLPTGKDSTRFIITIAPMATIMANKYSFKPIEDAQPAYYKYNSPIGGGLKITAIHTPSRAGFDLIYQAYGSVNLGEAHNDKNLSPFSTVAVNTKQFEQRLSIAPFYNWSRNSSYRILTGLILTNISNKLTSADLTRKDGKTLQAVQYQNEYGSRVKTSAGFYAGLGLNIKRINCGLHFSYEWTDAKYFKNAESKPRNTMIFGFSMGYNIFKK